MLLWYDYQNGITNEEEDIILATKSKLFSIRAIGLPKTIQFVKTIDVEIMDTNGKTSTSKLNYGVHNTEKKSTSNKYELEIALKDKVYSKTYYNHQPRTLAVDETLTKVKAQEL